MNDINNPGWLLIFTAAALVAMPLIGWAYYRWIYRADHQATYLGSFEINLRKANEIIYKNTKREKKP